MDRDQFELMAQESTKDVEFLAKLKSELTGDEFAARVFETFRRFIDNEEVITRVIKLGTHTWEVSVILEMEKECWFSDALLYLTQTFRSTMHANKEQCISLIESLYPDIHESLACWHDSFFLQKNIDLRNPRHAVRAYFRMLGDMVESSHKPHINFIYQVLRLDPSGPLHGKPRNVSLGKSISMLSEMEILERIYKSNLLNVRRPPGLSST